MANILESGNFCSSDSYAEYHATPLREQAPLLLPWIVGLIITVVTYAFIIVFLPKVPDIFGANGQLCLLCLAANDLFGGLACLIGVRIITDIDNSLVLANRCMCVAGSTVCTTFISQTELLLLVVTVERFVAILHPLHYPTMLTSARIKILLALSFVTGFLLSLGRSLHAYASDLDPGACVYYKEPLTSVHLISVFIFGAIMVCMEIKVLMVAKQQRKKISQIIIQDGAHSNQNSPHASPHHHHHHRVRNKASVTVALVVGSYFAVWTPYTVGSLVVSITRSPIPQWCNVLIIYIAFCHHFTNAIIYFIMHKAFCRSVMHLLRNRRTEPEVSASTVDGHLALDNHACSS